MSESLLKYEYILAVVTLRQVAVLYATSTEVSPCYEKILKNTIFVHVLAPIQHSMRLPLQTKVSAIAL